MWAEDRCVICGEVVRASRGRECADCGAPQPFYFGGGHATPTELLADTLHHGGSALSVPIIKQLLDMRADATAAPGGVPVILYTSLETRRRNVTNVLDTLLRARADINASVVAPRLPARYRAIPLPALTLLGKALRLVDRPGSAPLVRWLLRRGAHPWPPCARDGTRGPSYLELPRVRASLASLVEHGADPRLVDRPLEALHLRRAPDDPARHTLLVNLASLEPGTVVDWHVGCGAWERALVHSVVGEGQQATAWLTVLTGPWRISPRVTAGELAPAYSRAEPLGGSPLERARLWNPADYAALAQGLRRRRRRCRLVRSLLLRHGALHRHLSNLALAYVGLVSS